MTQGPCRIIKAKKRNQETRGRFETDENRRFLRFETDENRRFLCLNGDENRSNRRKKGKGFDRFWRNKSDENRRFLMFESDDILNSGGPSSFPTET